ncbi:restriction endonuclease subunit S [[Kitasatospora] papulosa]|uniref:restriction endonuclease subunit S n=1 Tax=[Kitasatospora] papulosa TaxID=1464011 RepID=UPI0038660E4A
MSEWEQVRLDEVIALDIEAVPVTATASYGIVGVLNRGRGLLFREPIAGDGTSYKTLNRIRPNQIVYSRLKAFEGAITVAPNDLGEAYASQEFPTFTCGERMLPEYFRLLTTTTRLWKQLQALSTGMGGRRERVKPADFLTIAVALPSLSDQCRIVDVVAAVDMQIESVRCEHECATEAVRRARLSLLSVGVRGQWQSEMTDSHTSLTWTERLPAGWWRETIGAVSVVRSGATPRRSEQARYFDGGSIPWVKSGDLNERVIGETDECITEVGFAESSVRLLPADTVLVAMYGGFGQIGRTARLAVPSTTNQAISALTDLRADVVPAYLHQALKAGRPKWRLVAASSRKDPNISKRDVENFDFPLPGLDEQREIVDVLEGMESATDMLAGELYRLSAFRSALLASLLNQEIEIPESYDALLEGVS